MRGLMFCLSGLLLGLPATIAFAQSAAFHPGPQASASSAKPNATQSSAALTRQLDKLYSSSVRYTTYFQKISCQERVHSEQNSNQQGFNPRPVHWKMDTKDSFVVSKDSTGVVGFKEARTYTEQDGRAVDPSKKLVPPYILTNAFGSAVLAYFSPLRRACLHFSISHGRIDFNTLPGKGGVGDCADIAPDAVGYALFDAGTETISHLERTIPLSSSRVGGFAPFAAVDYQPYGYDGNLYMLPAQIKATKVDKSIIYTFEAKYEGCHLTHSISVVTDSHGNPIPDASGHAQ